MANYPQTPPLPSDQALARAQQDLAGRQEARGNAKTSAPAAAAIFGTLPGVGTFVTGVAAASGSPALMGVAAGMAALTAGAARYGYQDWKDQTLEGRGRQDLSRDGINEVKQTVRQLTEQLQHPVMQTLGTDGNSATRALWYDHHEALGELLAQKPRDMNALLASPQGKADLQENPEALAALTKLDRGDKKDLRALAQSGLSKQDIQALAGTTPVGGSVPGGSNVQSANPSATDSPQRNSPQR